jgi:hypothetical protein
MRNVSLLQRNYTRYIPEGCHLHACRHENMKSQIYFIITGFSLPCSKRKQCEYDIFITQRILVVTVQGLTFDILEEFISCLPAFELLLMRADAPLLI